VSTRKPCTRRIDSKHADYEITRELDETYTVSQAEPHSFKTRPIGKAATPTAARALVQAHASGRIGGEHTTAEHVRPGDRIIVDGDAETFVVSAVSSCRGWQHLTLTRLADGSAATLQLRPGRRLYRWPAPPSAPPAPTPAAPVEARRPRLCPGCRSRNGEHTFAAGCTLIEPDAGSLDDR
jgi:hypothetical protein